MKYNMTQQYARSEEKPIAGFNELNDATNFMTKKSSSDEDEGKKVIYIPIPPEGTGFIV